MNAVTMVECGLTDFSGFGQLIELGPPISFKLVRTYWLSSQTPSPLFSQCANFRTFVMASLANKVCMKFAYGRLLQQTGRMGTSPRSLCMNNILTKRKWIWPICYCDINFTTKLVLTRQARELTFPLTPGGTWTWKLNRQSTIDWFSAWSASAERVTVGFQNFAWAPTRKNIRI